MPRTLSLIVLILAPIMLTIAIVVVGMGINAVGRGFGSTKSSAPIVVAAMIFWLLHSGYLLGPWLYAAERRTLALWLMVPIALVGLAFAVFVFAELLPGNLHAAEGRVLLGSVVWGLGVLFAYLSPIVVMLIGEPRSEKAAFLSCSHELVQESLS